MGTPLCSQGTAATNNISATPTFLFFRNKVRIDQYQGADAVGLEDKIKQHLENDPGNSEDTDIPKGYVCISPERYWNACVARMLKTPGFQTYLKSNNWILGKAAQESHLSGLPFPEKIKILTYAHLLRTKNLPSH